MIQRNAITFLILFLAIFTIHAQKDNTIVSALKLGTEIVSDFTKIKNQAFTFTREGILQASDGFEIVFRAASNEMIIKRSGQSVTSQMLAATSQDLPGGAKLRCIGCQDCQIQTSEGPTGNNYYCAGNCPDHGCSSMVQVPKKSISEFKVGSKWIRV